MNVALSPRSSFEELIEYRNQLYVAGLRDVWENVKCRLRLEFSGETFEALNPRFFEEEAQVYYFLHSDH